MARQMAPEKRGNKKAMPKEKFEEVNVIFEDFSIAEDEELTPVNVVYDRLIQGATGNLKKNWKFILRFNFLDLNYSYSYFRK